MTERQDDERSLVGRIALVFEGAGMSPIAGRLIARLLLCEPAEQSATQLADWLGVSKGSISTQAQLLLRAGLIERLRKPGSRSVWYRLTRHVWSKTFAMEIHRTRLLGELSREAIAARAARGLPPGERLDEFLGFIDFFAARLPALIAEWEQLTREG